MEKHNKISFYSWMFYSHRFKNNDYNHAITIPSKENNRPYATSETFSYNLMLKIKEKMNKIDLRLFSKNHGFYFI